MQNLAVYREVPREQFLAALKSAQLSRGDNGLCVSHPEESAKLFLSHDGLSGFALDGDYLGSVFSHVAAPGRLESMVRLARRMAKEAGFVVLRLDCFAGLERVYARHGFYRMSSVSFDWQYAPEGWREDMGEPDVVFMAAPLQG